MQNHLDITSTSRNSLAKFLDGYSAAQLNHIPPGFNNNLIWNVAHIIVVQQMLVYNLSGLPMMISDEMVQNFKRGTKPGFEVAAPDIADIRSLLFKTIEKTREDFELGIFREFQEFTTMSGYTIKNANDATAFNIYHEGVHMGMMMSIRKFL